MKFINRHNKVAVGVAISFCTLLVIYFAASIYFANHLYFGSKINGTNVSGKTVAQVKAKMESELNKYTLSIKERGGRKEQIKASDISLKYKSDKQFQDFKNKQNPLKWISSIFNAKNYKMIPEVSYDKEKLKQKVDNLSCLADKNMTEPKEPSLKYTDNAFVIEKEVEGSKIDKNTLLKHVTDAVANKDTAIDLEASNCYINPKFTSKSQKVTKAKETLNKYVSSKITYTFGNNNETLDGSKINNWLTVDNDFNAVLDEEKVKEYVLTLAYKYNTANSTRSFHTTSGNTISVSGGDYGWQLNVNKEVQDLLKNIKDGQKITKEPSYVQKAVSHDSNDIGNTYVEVDMTKQHLWFYKNGSLIANGDVVTGNVSLNTATPPGIYRLKDKEKNYMLKGQDYNTPVSYWMPFNAGIGLHDAYWRTAFGGEIYKTSGSHGCVNLPPALAQTIYENIDVGTPIVCFY